MSCVKLKGEGSYKYPTAALGGGCGRGGGWGQGMVKQAPLKLCGVGQSKGEGRWVGWKRKCVCVGGGGGGVRAAVSEGNIPARCYKQDLQIFLLQAQQVGTSPGSLAQCGLSEMCKAPVIRNSAK